jgi:DMSO/TMAO reductase YedYZ heme-binding membrane subunit
LPHRRAPRHTRPDEGLDLNNPGVRIGLGAAVTVVMTGALFAAYNGIGTPLLDAAQAFLTYYAGVISLVALTTTVALGLAASERVVLPIPQRVRAQLVHRAAALIGVGFLVTHIGMKIAAGLVPAYGSVVPTTSLYIGMGALASDLMIVVVATGVMRGRFAQAERPWTWRVLHDLAYLAWPLSILHGLMAGRPPAAWVSWSYVVCLVAVGSALLIRVMAAFRPAVLASVVDAVDMTQTQPMPRAVPTSSPEKTQRTMPEPVPLLGRTGTDATPIGRAARRSQDTRLRRIV